MGVLVRLAASLLPRREPACRFPAKGPLLRPVTHAPQWCSALGTRRRVAVHTPPAPHRSFATRAQPAQPQQRTEQLSRRCSASRRMKPVLRGQPQSAWAAPRWRPGPRCAVRPGRTAPRAPPHGSPPRARPTAPPRHARGPEDFHGSLVLAQVRAHPAQLNEGAASGSRHPQAACLTPHPRALPAQADQQQDGWPKQPELRELFRPPTRHEWRLLRPAGARRP